MRPLDYSIDRSIFDDSPGYRRGLVVVRAASNDQPPLEELLRAEEARLQERLRGANVAEHPNVNAWRDAYRRFGAKPSEHRSSIEAMARRVLKPDQLPAINPLVDIGNIVSLRYLLPAGVHPLPADGDGIALRRTAPGDAFIPADGSPAEAPLPNEVVFCQGNNVLTRRWTWRQAAGTQTLPQTSDVFFNVDALPPVTDADLRAAMADIEQLVREHAGGQIVARLVLRADAPACKIP
ncbi:hypothetical protein HHL11_11680 [Ramlibacter sp. G-1-2-2]|uniref:B3/B4 tRNA-binding domain-containing protein n=1 Tax=Ramlibacter agri TaxID=2728837 RepID=A0A848H0D7_9BURK|nr:phenylalanine--tRNA ligase beta subunit-related protein [Ramlibacter agri]NML44416.1 hypothetical protein [Ramlibacter agri]